jgi:hypothetical protein
MMSSALGFAKEKDLVLQALRCTVGSKKALYAAVPITTGRRLWELGCKLKVRDLNSVARRAPTRYVREVLRPNIEAASEFVSELRSRGNLVIDPSKLEIKHWTQRHYALLWTEVIIGIVAGVVLSSDWVYSRGSVAECLTALKNNIPVMDADGHIVSVKRVNREIQLANEVARNCGLAPKFLGRAESIIQSLCHSRGPKCL